MLSFASRLQRTVSRSGRSSLPTSILLVSCIATAARHTFASSSLQASFSTATTARVCQGSSNDCKDIDGRTSAMMTKSRSVDSKFESVEQGEGAGARVRRSIGRRELRNFDPFLMLDEFKVPIGAGFPDHPHRGFETVTYMLDGAFEHEDFCGHRGKLESGDLQWMTAGRGIVHAEMPVPGADKPSHGLQLWINLAAEDKMVEPKYQELKAKDIPHVTKDGVTAIVIAGTAFGVDSPVYTRTKTFYLHFKMEPGSTLNQEIPKEMNSFLYTLSGDITVGPEDSSVACAPHHTVVLTKDDELDGITVKAGESPAEFVLIGGVPHGEPIEQYGPFVMNHPSQIQQAFHDYRSGSNGFEKARTFRSEIGKPLM
eukprot:m.31057 g.31057  ORF g.31057 m.31057 type:complete len:370 (+) comp9370_c1_seq1:410-1519(+)